MLTLGILFARLIAKTIRRSLPLFKKLAAEYGK